MQFCKKWFLNIKNSIICLLFEISLVTIDEKAICLWEPNFAHAIIQCTPFRLAYLMPKDVLETNSDMYKNSTSLSK